MGFFVSACLASVRSQRERNTRWLVFLDDRGPQWLRDEMAALSADGLFEPIWISGPYTADIVRAAIVQRCHAPILITTRLDSDDAVGVHFTATIRAEATAAPSEHLDVGLYLNPLSGVQIDRSGGVYRYDYPTNPFISYVERRRVGSAPRTVLQDFRHLASREHGPVREISTAPIWLQVVHGGNLMNEIRGTRIAPESIAGNFEIDLPFGTRMDRLELAGRAAAQGVALLRLWRRRPVLLKQFVLGATYRIRGTRTYGRLRER